MTIKHNILGWFEIPVLNMDRAVKFYETIFDFKLLRNQMGSLDMAWFPGVDKGMGATGSLVFKPEFYKPSPDGVLIYLTTPTGELNDDISKVLAAGGKVVLSKTLITEEIGYMAVILDTEGNRIALHSRKG